MDRRRGRPAARQKRQWRPRYRFAWFTRATACAPEGRKMQPNCAVSPGSVALMVPGSVSQMPPISLSLVEREPARSDALTQSLVQQIGERQFNHWFRGRTRLVIEQGELVVYAANPFLQKWLQKQHRPALVQAARSLIGPSAGVRFDVDASLS